MKTSNLLYHLPKSRIYRSKGLLGTFLLILLLGGSFHLQAQSNESQTVSVTVTNGEQIRCITKNMVEVELTPNPEKELVSMELFWTEDQEDPIIVEPGDAFTLSRTYDLSEFEDECRYDCRGSNGFCRRIEVFANYEGSAQENNSLLLTFKVPPKPSFQFDPVRPCINTEASIENTTCPSNDEDVTYTWDFGNGATSNEAEPNVTFDAPGDYTVRLTANSSVCGSAPTSRTVTVISPAQPSARPDQNIETMEADTFVICGQGNFSTRLIGSDSEGATRFEWSSEQLRVNILDEFNDTTVVTFDEPDTYSVTLEVDNGCDDPNQQTLYFKAVEARTLALNAQPDACATLSYTPDPLVEGATYRINGDLVSSFPVDLPPTADPYVVTADLSNACGDLSRRDSFRVATPEPVAIQTPAADTSLCFNSAPLSLAASRPGGRWTVDGQDIGNAFDPTQFEVGTFQLDYTVGEGDCAVSAQATIEILAGPQLEIGADTAVCIDGGPATLPADPTGGAWTGTGITDSLAGTFDPQTAGVGTSQLTYTFESPADGCTASAVKVVEVVDLPQIDLPDTLAVCDAAAPIDLNALSNPTISPAGGTLAWQGPGIADANAGLLDTEAAGGEGLIDLRVEYRVPPGCRQSDSLTVRIDPLVMATAPGDTTVCSNQGAVDLGGRPTGGVWLDEDGQTLPNPIDPADLGAGTYALTYLLNPGTTCESQAATTLTIAPSDGLSAGDDRYVCATENTIELPVRAGNWSGPALSGTNRVTVADLDTGRHTYTLTDPTLPPACNTDALTLFVQPPPGIDFAPDASNCVGAAVSMNNETLADRFRWDFGDGATGTAANPMHTYDRTGAYTITLEVETLSPLNGAPVCRTEATREVQVFEPPEFVGFTADATEGCSPLTVNFNNQSRGQRLDYTWDFGNGDSSTVVSPQGVNFTAEGRDTAYRVRLSVANGCGASFDTLTVRALAPPAAEFATEVTSEYCSGETVNIGHRSFADSLFWDFGNGQTYTGFEPPAQQYFTSLDNDTVRLRLEAVNRCGRDTASQGLVIVPTDARAAISVLDNRPCVGDTVFLRSLSRPREAPVEWTFPDGATASGLETFYVFRESGPQTITSKVFSCGLDSADLTLEVQPAPQLELSAPPQTCPATPIEIRMTTDQVEKQLFLGDSLISTSDRTNLELDTTGAFRLTARVLSPEGCTVEAERRVEVIEGPAATFSMLDSVCAGAPLRLQSTSVDAGSCLWRTSDGLTYDDCTARHAFRAQGDQSVRLILTNGIGCRDSTEKAVFVRPTPRADFTFEILEPCTPARVAFRSRSERANALNWQLPGGRTEVRTAFTASFPDAGALPVRLIASNDGICFDTLQREVTILGSPQLELTKIASCTRAEGYELQINTEPPAQVMVDGPGYSGDGSRHAGLQAGDYFLFAETDNGCVADSVTSIPAVDELLVSIPEDTLRIDLGETVPLQSTINQADAAINWSPADFLDDPASANPVAMPDFSTDFVLTVRDSAGCVKRDTVVVVVRIDRERGIYVPNAFTPDQSGHNDVFRLRSTNPGVREIRSFQVFDQTGALVFDRKGCQPNEPGCAWDGRFQGDNVRPGVYVYRIEIEFTDEEIVVLKGDVTLIR